MLTTINRYTERLKNAFRVAGPYSPDLGSEIAAVFGVDRLAAEDDDQVCYWYSVFKSVPALAGNFSTVTLRLSPGAGGRAIVDGISIGAQPGIQVYTIGISGNVAAGTPVAVFQGNPFAVRTGAAAPQTLGVLDINGEQTVGGRLAGAGYQVAANANSGLQLSREGGTLPPLVLTNSPQGSFNVVVEGNVVNLAVGAAMFGRWFPEAAQG